MAVFECAQDIVTGTWNMETAHMINKIPPFAHFPGLVPTFSQVCTNVARI